jgi:hypothetical protein
MNIKGRDIKSKLTEVVGEVCGFVKRQEILTVTGVGLYFGVVGLVLKQPDVAALGFLSAATTFIVAIVMDSVGYQGPKILFSKRPDDLNNTDTAVSTLES